MKNKVSGQFLSKQGAYVKAKEPGLDQATINQRLLDDFEKLWGNLEDRLSIIPGKELLSQLNSFLQEKYGVTLTQSAVIAAMKPTEIPKEIVGLITKLEGFRCRTI